MAEANNKFAFDFFAKARETEAGNIFFSPFSMSEAFGILYEGAKGNTARELEAVFGFEPSETVRLGDFKKLNARLNSGSDAYKLSVANSLWIERTYGVYDNYEALARDFYGSEINDADFIRDPEGSRTTINKWVEGKTNNKIIDLLPKGSVSALTRLVIANAIYFKGTWVKEFNKENTREEEFRQGDGKTVKAQMMYRTDKDAVFRYMENEKLQALEMPYKGNDISMLVLLPQNDDIDGLERGLAAKDLEEWRKDMRSQRVDVIFPKFKFTQKYELNDHLKAMGVRDAFTAGKADLTGIEPKRELYVTGAYHKAFVEVNEEGTEAAAATGIVVGITAAMPPRIPEFRADHPFIFIIQETATGNILFMGKVVDPMQ
ncbi:MAG TPA: serpin family protein [Candidatus Norongarragalinales archaeon]|nr:serpin family protein [Candidatus Norongarragalinales archaeon]